MAVVEVVKNEQGKLEGLGEKGGRAWRRFRKLIDDLGAGEILHFEWWEPRSPGFHKRHFVLLHAVFDQQDQFIDFDAFRMWTQVGAGYCDLMPGPAGRVVAIPRSLKYHKLDEVEFREVHRQVVDFLRGEHAAFFLWPHLSSRHRIDMIEGLLAQFDV